MPPSPAGAFPLPVPLEVPRSCPPSRGRPGAVRVHPARFPAGSQKADPEGTVERPSPACASGMGSDTLTQPEALPGPEDGVPGPDQGSPGHLRPPREAEAEAAGASGENPETGLELSAAPSGVREVPPSQEAAPGEGQGAPSSGPDPRPAEEAMRLTPGPPAQAKAAEGSGDVHSR